MESPLREWVEEAVWAAALSLQLAPREVGGVAVAAGDALEFALRGWPPDPEVRRGHAARFREFHRRGKEAIAEARTEVHTLTVKALASGDLSSRKRAAAVMLLGTLFLLGVGSAADVRSAAEAVGIRREIQDFAVECALGIEGFGGEHWVWRRFEELMKPLYRDGAEPEPPPTTPAMPLERLALRSLHSSNEGVARRAMRWLGLPPGAIPMAAGAPVAPRAAEPPAMPAKSDPAEPQPGPAGQGPSPVVLSFDDETRQVLAGDAPLKYRRGSRYLRVRHRGLRLLHALQYGEAFRDMGSVSVPDMNDALRRAGVGRVQIRVRAGEYELTGPVSFSEGLQVAMGLVRKRRPRLSK